MIKKIILALSALLIVCPVLAQEVTANNLSTLATPPGSGYFSCEVKPKVNLMSEKLRHENLLSPAVLKGFSAHIETHCVNVSGMICQSNTGQSGTLTTNLAWLTSHYFKYEKSGKENPDDTSACEENGIVQVLTDYTYEIQCHVSKTPPKNLAPINQPIC